MDWNSKRKFEDNEVDYYPAFMFSLLTLQKISNEKTSIKFLSCKYLT